MIGCAVFALGLLVTLLGAIMFAKAKKGEQCTLGGVIFIIGLLCIGFGGGPAFGHSHDSPGLNDWLAGLHAKNKTWCCNGNDTDAIEDWETKGNRYRVKFRGQWFDVPDEAVVDGPNKGGDALLWMNKGYIGASVRCFMPGSMT